MLCERDEVDRFFPSSKLCSCCGYKNDLLNLSIRAWICPGCQTTHDRDENASWNLRAEGIRILTTNTAGQVEIQACGETLRLVGTSTKKRQCGFGVSPSGATAVRVSTEARISRYTALRLAVMSTDSQTSSQARSQR
ncbi:MAG: zinc ribbon domain-containing protein [Nostoc sp. ChiSLP02]|nr:zinc ribbon domain-containing protein [Nostoc sp. DedSLP05]MDZ8097780.1 zinc ribbon domain-containing protein [Nostoc sp. DedSLP01]MDZ8183865.1 zinc ribbon domain-containing protein [Nostoc sp. ChiSLP02]